MNAATRESLLPVESTQIRLGWIIRRWESLAVAAILALAAGLNFYALGRKGYANSYYSAAVRSMLQSWHNFFFVSFDPGGFVTVDKPPLGFWIQTASAKLFGFHGWSILAPQALAGVLSVLVLFLIVRRIFGPLAGLVAALAMAITPVAVADNRNNTIDSLLVLTLLFAAWAVLRATESGRLRWLIIGMALVGVGFNIKMLEAYLVLPALVALYLVAAPRRWPVRILHLAIAGVVLAVVSLSWAVAVDLTPANQRPYVGSSQHNSEIELAFGYNGVQRLLGMGGPPAGSRPRPAATGASASDTAVTDRQTANTATANAALPAGSATTASAPAPGDFQPPPGGGPGFVQGSAGPLRLFDEQLGGQASWLLPLGLIGGLAVLAISYIRAVRPRGLRLLLSRPDAPARQVVLWGTWMLTVAGFFSVAGFFHPYYLIMLAPAAAALAGIGITTLWSAVRGPRLLGWLFPVAVLATAATQVYLLAPYPRWNHWLSPLVIGLATIAAIAMIVARLRPSSRVSQPALAAAMVLALAGLLIAPGFWSGITTVQGDGGVMPSGGPAGFPGFGLPPGVARAPGGGGPPAGFAGPGLSGPAGGPPAGFAGPGLGGPAGGPPGMGGGEAGQQQLLDYLQANRSGARFLLAVPSSMAASSIIIQTGEPVMALGGFSGGDPILTSQQIAQDVAANTVRFFLISGPAIQNGTDAGRPTTVSSDQGTASAPTDDAARPTGGFQPPIFGGSNPGTAGAFQPPIGVPGPFGQRSAAETWVTAHCSTVASSKWQSPVTAGRDGGFGFGPGGAQQLYDCSTPASGS